MIPNSRRRSCTEARKDVTAMTKPRISPTVETRPSVELVTFPANSAENCCWNVTAALPPTVS